MLYRTVKLVQKKVVVITGATSGIGLEMARDLADKGYEVVMACRDKEKGACLAGDIIRQTGNAAVKVFKLDMASMQSIEAFSSAFSKEYDTLAVLVNNAGVFCDRLEYTVDGFEMTMGVNYLGSFLLTRLLLPVIKNTPGARIVNVTSRAAFYAKLKLDNNLFTGEKHGFKAYAASKLAQIMFTIDLAEELAGTGITVNVAYPGRVATNIWKGSSLLMKLVAPLMTRKSISAAEGAKTGIYLADSPGVEGVTGKLFYFEEILEYSSNCLDENKRKELMKLSFEAVGDVVNIEKS